MIKRRTTIHAVFHPVLIVAMVLLVAGCAANPRWYKPGSGQVDFNFDDQECRRTAEEFARQATLTRKKIDPEIFAVAYENCIFSKGWTHTPLDSQHSSGKLPVALAEVSGNVISVFNNRISLPEDFKMLTSQVSGFQDPRAQILTFQGDGPVFLTIVMQEALSRKFVPVDYPVEDPFFIFERGQDKKEAGKLRWTIFAGEFQKEWLTGMGAYLLVDKTRRITFVITQNISSPENPPPSGLKLTEKQKNEIIKIHPGMFSIIGFSGARHR